MSVIEDFADVQKSVNVEIFRNNGVIPPIHEEVQKTLKEISEYGEESCRNALGEMGAKLWGFANNIDVLHPDLNSFMTTTQCNILSETLKIYNYAKLNKLDTVLPQIRAIATKDLREPFRDLDNPKKITRWVRLLKTGEERKVVRSSKLPIKIDMTAFYNNYVPETWENFVFSSAKAFVRNNKFRELEIEKAQRKSDKYKEIGCISLSQEIERSLGVLKSRADENFMGFQRVTMSDIAYVLARVHGFQYQIDPWDKSKSLKISGSFCDFDFEDRTEPEAGLPLARDYEYFARSYPIHELASIMGDNTAKVIEHLENLPEVGGRPIFDHYVVVTPTIIPRSVLISQSFKNKAGQKVAANDLPKCIASKGDSSMPILKAFDVELIINKSIMPILMAEREGKCYFISYFETK